MSNPSPNRKDDWAFARQQYECTPRSTDEIGRDIGVSPTMIISRASREGWSRRRQETAINRAVDIIVEAKLSKQEEQRLRFEAIEKVSAIQKAELLVKHRTDIKKARAITMTLFEDLKEINDPDLGSKIVQRLSVAMKTFILLERQAYGVQGVFEDPEMPIAPAMIQEATLNNVMDKFAQVLNFRKETQSAPMAVEIVENEPTRQH